MRDKHIIPEESRTSETLKPNMRPVLKDQAENFLPKDIFILNYEIFHLAKFQLVNFLSPFWLSSPILLRRKYFAINNFNLGRF